MKSRSLKSLSFPNLWEILSSLQRQSFSAPNLWVNSRILVAVLVLATIVRASAAETNSFPVSIRVDASRPLGPLRPICRLFGGDEPNYATTKDGQKLLA